jgi:hypothetical protein
MLTTTTKKRLALLATAGALLGAAAMTSGGASADPQQFSAFAGVGSDTTQDVLNAFSGFARGTYFTPVNAGAANGYTQINSFDATGGGCITSKLNGPSYDRPNGSSAGRRALSRSLDLTGFGTAACGGVKNISGQVDFARSSAGPTSGDTGTQLAYIPFGRDAMSLGYYRAVGSPVTSFTRAQITSLFTTGPQTINGVFIVPCGIQTSSGTFQFWNQVTTATTAQENTAVGTCKAIGAAAGLPERSQESDPSFLKAKGDALELTNPGAQVVIGYSAGNFIASTNGTAPPPTPQSVNVGIATITNNGNGVDIGNPIIGTTAPVEASPTFYNDVNFGRTIYNVVSNGRITGPGNAGFKYIFTNTGPGSICAQTNTIRAFGFLPIATCGQLGLTGSYFSGQNP